MPLAKVIAERPDVFNHNVEVAPRLYPVARRGSRWERSLRVLANAKEMGGDEVVTKSGLMVGLGETHEEMVDAFGQLREQGVQVLTVGQYLRPTERHLPVVRYWHPDEFKALEAAAYELGFEHIAAGPLVRSSYHADEHVKQSRPGVGPVAACLVTPGRALGSAAGVPAQGQHPHRELPVRHRRADRRERARCTSSSSTGDLARRPEQPGLPARTCSTTAYFPYELTHPGEQCVPQGSQIACGESVTGLPATWVTVFTAMFMHGGLLHLGGNMLFLWIFGNNVEDSMGPVKFLVFYLLGGLAATAGQTLVDPDAAIPNIGASGAVAAVLGGYLILFPRARVVTVVILIFFFTILELPAMIFLVIWFAQQALFGYFGLINPGEGGGGVAYFAHIGGFVFGLAAIKLFASERRRRRQIEAVGRLRTPRTVILAVALLFTCAMAFATVYVLLDQGPDIFTLFGVLIVAAVRASGSSAR